VPIALAIRTLGNLSFVLLWLKFNFTLLKEFDIKYILIVRGRFEVYKKNGVWYLGLNLLDIPYVLDFVTKLLYF
jgi:hypothetical protein